MRPSPVIVLSTADFDAPIWTNKQHIAVRLAKHAEVHYINSTGVRRATLSIQDVRRSLGRIVKWFAGRQHVAAGLKDEVGPVVHSPLILPFPGSTLARAANRILLKVQLRTLRNKYSSATLWSFTPLTYGLERDFARVVYHSVDLLHALPNVDSEVFLAAERVLIRSADVVVASSSGVKEHLEAAGRLDVRLWQNVADTRLFSHGIRERSERSRRAIFAGNLTPYKIDVGVLLDLVEDGLQLSVAGPVSIDGSTDCAQIEKLISHPRVQYLGNLSQHELAEQFRDSMIGLIPYLDNSYTRGVFPMKLYEYLAAGLVVVALPMRSLAGAPVSGLIISDAQNFSTAVQEQIGKFDREEALIRSQQVSSHSWESRISQIIEVLQNG